MHLFEKSPVTFTIERRHRLGRPVTVAESTTSNLSDLMSRQQIDGTKPLTIELKVGAQSVTIEVRIQTYNIVSGIKVDDQRPKAIYRNYPATASS
ncbi:hypothetical protein AGABI2DRAFT_185643, partial [Agaricus bisporus var. bisporus H97]|uniref:hypothetical protein n=1 Tax=Agaricus bisporus var. bisporus (strain H97 / ATCC MYA-4626 / FGSC 10389) TaxID=936046 RepID=UPI00029F58E3